MKRSKIKKRKQSDRAKRFNSSPAEQAFSLLRDFAARLAKEVGFDSDKARRQLRAINHAARQIVTGGRSATTVSTHCTTGSNK